MVIEIGLNLTLLGLFVSLTCFVTGLAAVGAWKQVRQLDALRQTKDGL